MEATDGSSDEPTATSHIKEPLQKYVLPQLQLFELLSLQRTCSAWRDLIDSTPVGPLLPAATQVIPEGVLRQITTSVNLLLAARQQARVLHKLHSSSSSLQQLPKLFSNVQDCSGWSHWDPSVGHHRWAAVSSWRPAASNLGPASSTCPGSSNPRRKMAHPWHQVIQDFHTAILPQIGSMHRQGSQLEEGAFIAHIARA